METKELKNLRTKEQKKREIEGRKNLRTEELKNGRTRKNRIFLFFCFLVFLFFGSLVLPFFHLCYSQESLPAVKEDKISLDLKSVDINELLRILSLKTGRTIVPSKSLSGRVTIFLNNISFDDVLDIILLSQGLSAHKSGDIIYVLTNAEYKAIHGKDYLESRKLSTVKLNYGKPANIFNAISQLKSDIGKIIVDEASGTIILMDIPEKLELMKKTVQELDRPLQTAVYDLNYVKPGDAKTALSSALTPGTGEVIIDERSGKAIISDLPRKMDKLDALVKTLDEETRQVFIEAEIVQVTLSKNYQRGVDWEKVFGESIGSLDLVGYFPVSPALSVYQKLTLGTFSTDRYKIITNFLEKFGDTEILSQPKLAVVNKEEASIMVGSREAYVTQTASQSTSTTVTSETVEFIDVGIKLKVSPVINKDGFITMKIKPEVSSVKETITTSLGSRIPIVQTSEAETSVKVKDGVTIMLGGMVEESQIDTIDGLPVLSRLPLLGGLFGRRSKENKKTELIVFITPHLIRGDAPRKGAEYEKFIPPAIEKTHKEESLRVENESGAKAVKIKKRELAAKAKEKKELEREEIEKRRNIKEEEAKKKKAAEEEKARQEEEAKKKEEANKREQEEKIKAEIPAASLRPAHNDVITWDRRGFSLPARHLAGGPTGRQVTPPRRWPDKNVPPILEKSNLKITPLKSAPEEYKKRYRSQAGLFAEQAESHYQEGLKLQRGGNLEDAGIYYRKAILIDRQYAPAYNQLGIVLQAQGLGDEAKEMYLAAIEIDPKFPPAYSNLALLFEAGEDFSPAAGYWSKRASLGRKKEPWVKTAKERLKLINAK